jgi:hypothetical protein
MGPAADIWEVFPTTQMPCNSLERTFEACRLMLTDGGALDVNSIHPCPCGYVFALCFRQLV